MIRRLSALLLAFVLLLPLGVSAEDAEPSELDRAVDGQFRNFGTRCGEVVAAKDGEIVYQRSYGFADPGKKIPVTPDHYYRLASVSKLVTASAYMRLVETGRIDLDENIGSYLHLEGEPSFFAASPRYKKTGLTSRMLMSHTACIWCDKFSPRPAVTKAVNLEANKGHKEYFYEEKPGTAYHYSNYGAGILGCIMEAVTGQRLDDAASELLFDRMGLDAGYSPDYLEVPENITSDVIREYGDGIDLDNDYVFSYGNCWMRGSDLCRIGMMLCDYGLYDGQRILEEETVREMISSQKGKGGITVNSPYGLNIQRTSFSKSKFLNDHMVYGHQGVIDDVLCAVIFDPETRFVFALVSVCRDPLNVQQKIDGGFRALPYNLLRALWMEFGAGS